MSRKSRVLRKEYHQKGKRLYGVFCYQDSGKHYYVAFRKIKEIYQNRNHTISEAIRKGEAGWALDMETILAAQSRACVYIVIKDRQSGNVWITRLENYLDPYKTATLDWSRKGSTLQKCLPLSMFRHQQNGSVKL